MGSCRCISRGISELEYSWYREEDGTRYLDGIGERAKYHKIRLEVYHTHTHTNTCIYKNIKNVDIIQKVIPSSALGKPFPTLFLTLF